MIDQFDMEWLRKISPTYEERFWKLVQRKHKHIRHTPGGQSIDIKKDFKLCSCGRKIVSLKRKCSKCLIKQGYLDSAYARRGKLAERPAMPDREVSWRYVV